MIGVSGRQARGVHRQEIGIRHRQRPGHPFFYCLRQRQAARLFDRRAQDIGGDGIAPRRAGRSQQRGAGNTPHVFLQADRRFIHAVGDAQLGIESPFRLEKAVA